MNTLFDILRSRKLAIGLFIVISGLAVVGTMVPQAHLTSPGSYQAFLQKSPTLAPLAQRLGLTALYYSWWFYALLLLLLANTTVCTISRLAPLWRLLTRRPALKDSASVRAMAGHKSVMWPDGEPDGVASRVAAAFRDRGYAVRCREGKSEASVAAWRGRAGPLGSIVFHLSFIPILLGILSMTLFGLRGVVLVDQKEPWNESHGDYLSLTEGYLFGERHPGFQVSLNGVRANYRGFDLVDLAADVTMADGPQKTRHTIRVNHPLSYKGFLFVLSSYGYAPLVRITENGYERVSTYMNVGSHGIESFVFSDRFALPGLLQADLRFYPDADYTRGKVRVISQNARRPLLKVLLRRQGQVVFDSPVAIGKTVRQGGVQVTFSDWRYYAMFKLVKDPGWSLLAAGFTLALAGLALRTSLAYRRFWIAGERRGGGLELLLVGKSDRYGTRLEQELESLLARLRELGKKEA